MYRHIINHKKKIKDALIQLNDLGTDPMVLFVIDDDGVVLGTLTDGDLRRALIAGADTYTMIDRVMHREFRFIEENIPNIVEKIKELKALNIASIPVLNEKKHIVDIINLSRYKTKLPVDVVLMAGGKGERLRPLTEKTPKPLLLVGDKAIIDHNVDRLINCGVKHISVTVNYLKEQLEEHYSVPRNGIKINCYREPKFLGTMGAVKFVPNFYNDTILVMNSDLFTNINYEEFFIHFKEHGADMSIAAVPYSISVPYGIFELEGRDVKGVLEKPTYNYYANAGIYLIKKDMLKYIPDDTFFNATDMIQLLIKKNKKVIRFPLNGTWIDIGNPQEYQKARELIKHLS